MAGQHSLWFGFASVAVVLLFEARRCEAESPFPAKTWEREEANLFGSGFDGVYRPVDDEISKLSPEVPPPLMRRSVPGISATDDVGKVSKPAPALSGMAASLPLPVFSEQFSHESVRRHGSTDNTKSLAYGALQHQQDDAALTLGTLVEASSGHVGAGSHREQLRLSSVQHGQKGVQLGETVPEAPEYAQRPIADAALVNGRKKMQEDIRQEEAVKQRQKDESQENGLVFVLITSSLIVVFGLVMCGQLFYRYFILGNPSNYDEDDKVVAGKGAEARGHGQQPNTQPAVAAPRTSLTSAQATTTSSSDIKEDHY